MKNIAFFIKNLSKKYSNEMQNINNYLKNYSNNIYFEYSEDKLEENNFFINGDSFYYSDYSLIAKNAPHSCSLFKYQEDEEQTSRESLYFDTLNYFFEKNKLDNSKKGNINFSFKSLDINLIKKEDTLNQDNLKWGITFPCVLWEESLNLRNMQETPCLFLDRDGVLVEDTGYLSSPNGLKFNDSILPVLKKFKENGFRLIVITNQSGIARGYFTENEYLRVNEKIISSLNENGITLDAIYFCPYFENAKIPKFDKKSFMRKPGPGMIFKACSDFNIDLSRSVMIGDKKSDVLNLPGIRYIVNPLDYSNFFQENLFNNLKN